MAFHHVLMAGAYRIQKAIEITRGPRWLGSPNSLRVLIYHDIAPGEQSHFAAQLRWLARLWRFVSAEQFAALISGDEPILGRNLLLTFDDGFASHRRVAEDILNPMGIRALFFSVSDLVAVNDREEARDFIAQNLFPGSKAGALPAHCYNMGWSDLEALLEQGHSIGAHTRTHARLSQIKSECDLEGEIVSGADALAQHLGVNIEHFAYSFGDIASLSPEAFSVARRRFPYIYTGVRGENARDVSPWAVRREALKAPDSIGLLGAYVEGIADFRYASARAQLARWISEEGPLVAGAEPMLI